MQTYARMVRGLLTLIFISTAVIMGLFLLQHWEIPLILPVACILSLLLIAVDFSYNRRRK